MNYPRERQAPHTALLLSFRGAQFQFSWTITGKQQTVKAFRVSTWETRAGHISTEKKIPTSFLLRGIKVLRCAAEGTWLLLGYKA